jgi:hypothetical protein
MVDGTDGIGAGIAVQRVQSASQSGYFEQNRFGKFDQAA